MMELMNKRPIPEGLEVHHKCRVKNCCNPKHLAIVTRRENTLEAAKLGMFRGERNSNAKLTEDMIKYIWLLYDWGKPVREIRQRLPVSVSREMIYYILARRYWAHVEFPESLGVVKTNEMLLKILHLMDAIYRDRTRKGLPLPKGFGKLCRLCAWVLISETHSLAGRRRGFSRMPWPSIGEMV
jgi:hypothetical protein